MLADPVGAAVSVITSIEPGLARPVAVDAVMSVAAGRAKRRKLAQALTQRPAVLADGRSPAPRVVGDLLIALRKAGASAISPPVCAKCAKPLRTLQRQGEDWYCSVCIRRPGRCSACGQDRIISAVDRKGQPRCKQCPDRDDRDPLAVLTATVTAADPSLIPHVVRAAACRVFSRPSHLQKLAWAIEEDTGLLTGGGAHAPISGVLRLIDELCDAGAQAITRPACPRCLRVVHLHRRIDGLWCCRNWVARSRAQPCARCGAVREAAARDEHGRPLCPYCLITDPVNLETCTGCGRRRPVSVRAPGGPLCENCRPVKTMTCSICDQHAPCYISKATGEPWCEPCRHRWARCTECGELRQVRGGTLAAPLCATCARPEPGFWHACPDCGQPGRIHHGRCARCTIQRRLRRLLGGQASDISPQLEPLYQALASTDRPGTIEGWLNKSAAPAILRDLAARNQPLTHATLDGLPPGKTVEHLRAVLVATGTLPPRDEQLARLERWISQVITERPDTGQRQLLHRYAVWHVVRRLRGRLGSTPATHDQVVAAQRNIKAAIALLGWLTASDLTLDGARQGDLEAWLASAQPTHRTDAGNFVRWARRHKLTRLDFATVRWGGPSGVIDTEARWAQARRLLHDGTLKPEDRLAGLLVLLYAQRASAISCLTLDHVQDNGHQVRLHLGREPVVLPEPLDTLARQVAAARHGHAALGDRGTSPWLFPGGQPGRPISAFRMAERLRQLGIMSGPARSAALFQLATDLPAAVLARLLGIHIAVAVAWQRASAGDWAAYAAQVSRRASRPHQPIWGGKVTSTDSGDTTGGGEPLTGDGVTPGIVRIGDTVRRPVRPFTLTVQAYLAHLHQAGFTAAPVPLGIDEQGREVLSFVPGDVPRDPLPAETTGDDVLAALARLIHALHDASAGWAPPPDAVWGGTPGAVDLALPPVDGKPELVSHRDYYPGNVVFRSGLPAALIDFDLAKPTTRLYDIANALWWWAPLRDPRDRAPAFTGLDIPQRTAVFADAYGMTAQQRQDLVPLMTRIAHRYHLTARASADADPVFRRLWEQGAKDELPRAEAWLQQTGPAIAARLTQTTSHRQP